MSNSQLAGVQSTKNKDVDEASEDHNDFALHDSKLPENADA